MLSDVLSVKYIYISFPIPLDEEDASIHGKWRKFVSICHADSSFTTLSGFFDDLTVWCSVSIN